MANHFCALALFGCACDMDHESATTHTNNTAGLNF